MQIHHLLLKSKDVSNAAINRISKPSLSLETYGDHRIESFVNWDMKKQLRYIACTENLMNRCEMGCTLLRVEIRCEYTTRHTFPPQKLASTTRPSSTAATTTTSSTTTATARTTAYTATAVTRI